YPSDVAATPVADGTVNPRSWSSIVQSGGQNTPGTDSFAYALCTQPAAPPEPDRTPVDPPSPVPRPAVPDFVAPTNPRVPPPHHPAWRRRLPRRNPRPDASARHFPGAAESRSTVAWTPEFQ